MVKNLSIASDVKTNSEFYGALLDKNRGIAFGEAHSSTKSFNEVTANMAMLKKHGVDTIYLEGPSAGIRTLALFPPDSLRSVANKYREYAKHPDQPEFADIDKEVRQGIKLYHGTVSRSDFAKHLAAANDLAATANENGIRLAPMDLADRELAPQVKLLEKDFLKGHIQRINSTNKEWVANIEADRKIHHGKFVIIGGANHFVCTEHTRGLVGEKLGIPVIVPTKSLLSGRFNAAHDKGGADYYIPSGLHETDIRHKILKVSEADLERSSRVGGQLHKTGISNPPKDIHDVSKSHIDKAVVPIEPPQRNH